MADWVTITDSQVDPDAPLTSELAYAWRDNPIAIAEGAVGAPRIVPTAMKGGNLLPTIGAFAGVDAVIVGLGAVADLGGWLTITGGTFDISLSSDNGSTWGARQSPFVAGANGSGLLSFNLITGFIRWISYSATITGAGPSINAIRLRAVGSGVSFSLQPVIEGGK